MKSRTIKIRFYAELNDFLSPPRKFTRFEYPFNSHQTVKDIIEALGVPHPEVDLILVNGKSVDFEYRVQDGDDVAVYPVFESMNIQALTHLRPKPLRKVRFIVDINLGRLARYLRMLGFDTLYHNDFGDQQIVDRAVQEHRIILTRDQDMLKHKTVTHGYWVRNTRIIGQLHEVIKRFDLAEEINPFTRCMLCNGMLHSVPKGEIIDRLEKGTKRDFDEFYQCDTCGKIYWKGSHYERMKSVVEEAKNNSK